MFSRIGARLYAALGLAVMLTLLSSGVGVYSGQSHLKLQPRHSGESRSP